MPAQSSFSHPLGSLNDKREKHDFRYLHGLNRRLGLACPDQSVRLSMIHLALSQNSSLRSRQKFLRVASSSRASQIPTSEKKKKQIKKKKNKKKESRTPRIFRAPCTSFTRLPPQKKNTKKTLLFSPNKERNGPHSQEATCLNLSHGNPSGPSSSLISGNQKRRWAFPPLLKTLEEMKLHHSPNLNCTVNFSTSNHHPFLPHFCLHLITILSKLVALLGKRTRKHYTQAPADFSNICF